jgi:hypothetical protein
MSLSTLVRIMKIQVNNIHESKLKSDVLLKQDVTHESYTYVQNQISCLVSTILLLDHFHTLLPTSFIPHDKSYI